MSSPFPYPGVTGLPDEPDKWQVAAGQYAWRHWVLGIGHWARSSKGACAHLCAYRYLPVPVEPEYRGVQGAERSTWPVTIADRAGSLAEEKLYSMPFLRRLAIAPASDEPDEVDEPVTPVPPDT